MQFQESAALRLCSWALNLEHDLDICQYLQSIVFQLNFIQQSKILAICPTPDPKERRREIEPEGLFIKYYFGEDTDKRVHGNQEKRLLYWSIDWQLETLVLAVLFIIIKSRTRIHISFPWPLSLFHNSLYHCGVNGKFSLSDSRISCLALVYFTCQRMFTTAKPPVS